MRQRLRWSKGHLQAFAESGPYLFINIFMGKKYIKTNWSGNKETLNKKSDKGSKWANFVESIRHRFASFDTLVQLTPISFINLCRWLIVMVLIYSAVSYVNGINDISLFSGGIWLAKFLRNIADIKINVEPGLNALLVSMIISIWFRILYRIGNYFVNMWLAVYLFIIEHERIKKMSIWKKILFTFTWPTFDIIGRYTIYIALFKKVEWKPIPHESKVTIDDLGGE